MISSLKNISIPKGKHRSSHGIKLLWRPEVMLVSFSFDESAKYLNTDKLNQTDWNKLCGFSRGLHHKNSVRLAWRWEPTKNTLQVCEYFYVGGSLILHNVRNVDMNTEYQMIIEIHAGNYPSWGYVLYPYFGGPEKAPHQIDIKLRHNP